MRRLLLAGTAALALATPVLAADVAMPGPAVTAPAPYAPAGPWRWSGFYFGGNFGGDWAQVSSTTSNSLTGAFVSSDTRRDVGILGGVQAGINWQFSNAWMVGVEGDFDWAGNSHTLNSADGSFSEGGRLRDLATARARLGVIATNWLIYVTGGAAWSQSTWTRTQITGTVSLATPGTVESVTNNRFGWAAGAGVEMGFAQNWTFRVEYLFLGLGSANYTFPLAGRTSSQILDTSVVRAGINYKFDWGGPVTARY
jgi:outer membrane immunogenic protein